MSPKSQIINNLLGIFVVFSFMGYTMWLWQSRVLLYGEISLRTKCQSVVNWVAIWCHWVSYCVTKCHSIGPLMPLSVEFSTVPQSLNVILPPAGMGTIVTFCHRMSIRCDSRDTWCCKVSRGVLWHCMPFNYRCCLVSPHVTRCHLGVPFVTLSVTGCHSGVTLWH